MYSNNCHGMNITNNIRLLQDVNSFRPGCARRWTSLKQHPRNEVFSDTNTSSPLSTPCSTLTSSPAQHGSSGEPTRKSNWQVIEHFGSKDKGSLSSSLIAVSDMLRIRWKFM